MVAEAGRAGARERRELHTADASMRLTASFDSRCCLTLEFTRLRKRAKPAVAGRVQRRVRRRTILRHVISTSRKRTLAWPCAELYTVRTTLGCFSRPWSFRNANARS